MNLTEHLIMALRRGPATVGAGPGVDMLALVRSEGSRTHGWRRDPMLIAGPDAAGNLADVVHLVCRLHGRRPGLVDAAGHALPASLRDRALSGFAGERAYLAHLTAAVGPMPRTPGHALAQAAIVAQHHAVETLGRSDRLGCALGAVAALLMDWAAIRPVLDAGAVRFGVAPPPAMLPDPDGLAATIDDMGIDPAAARAIAFGARQLLLQHRGSWDLLAVRAGARRSG